MSNHQNGLFTKPATVMEATVIVTCFLLMLLSCRMTILVSTKKKVNHMLTSIGTFNSLLLPTVYSFPGSNAFEHCCSKWQSVSEAQEKDNWTVSTFTINKYRILQIPHFIEKTHKEQGKERERERRNFWG